MIGCGPTPQTPPPNRAAPNDRRIASPADAQALIDGLRETMAALEKVLTVETEHLRVGRINDGLADNERKSALTSAYLQGLEALEGQRRRPRPFRAARGLEILKTEHAAFARAIEDEPDRAGHGARGLRKPRQGNLGRARSQPATPGLRELRARNIARPAARQPLLVSRNL